MDRLLTPWAMVRSSKYLFFQSEIMYLAHHVSQEGIHSIQDIVHVIEDLPMPETYTQVHTFCELAGHYQCFIKGICSHGEATI